MEVVDHQETSVMGSKEQQQAALIAKGKRTKRQRLHSPIPFAVQTNSSSGELGGFVVVADHDDHHSDFVPQNNNDHYQNNTNFSPSSSSAYDELLQQFNNTSTTTEEEEDMANCLILLAQGRPPCSPLTKQLDMGPFHHVTNNVRRFSTENVDKGGGVGCYAYECKTCYRTFPSFQALGGHRASHKKPKAMEAEKKHILCSDDEEIQFKNNNITTTHSLSLQLNQRGSLNNSGKAKVHECAICGAEFTSGQALGGHMRRHRAMPVGTNTALSLTPMNMETEDQRQPKRQRSVLSLDLDLNLPAPQEHDQRSESKFLIKSNQQQQQQQPPQQQQHNKQQQQQPLVFPARTLVDCHY